MWLYHVSLDDISLLCEYRSAVISRDIPFLMFDRPKCNQSWYVQNQAGKVTYNAIKSALSLDGMALLGDWTTAGMVMTKFWFRKYARNLGLKVQPMVMYIFYSPKDHLCYYGIT